MKNSYLFSYNTPQEIKSFQISFEISVIGVKYTLNPNINYNKTMILTF